MSTVDPVKAYFAERSNDVTPATARHAAQVIHAALSHDPDVTKRCSSCLSDSELQRAGRFAKLADRTQYIQRRAFRRYCGALALGTSRPLAEIDFEETPNGRPRLDQLPDYCFSFSSCRLGFLGAWSRTQGIGVDIEDETRDPGAAALAGQFFSASEAGIVSESSTGVNPAAFFRLWCLKESALKSIGQGLPYGLDAFAFQLLPDLRVTHAPDEHGGTEKFAAHLFEGTGCCAAMVLRKTA